MLEIPPEWNKVPDLIMEDKKELMSTETNNMQKRDEVARGCRKRRKKDDICLEKHEHSPMVSRRTWNPEGFYSKDWTSINKKISDKWQRISQMVFHGRCLEINPEVIGDISRSCSQHKGGGCSVSVAQRIES